MPGTKMKSLRDIEQLQQQLLSRQQRCKARVLICMTGCRALGARDVAEKFRERLKGVSCGKEVAVVETGCIGMCAGAPVVLIEPYEYLYGGVAPGDVDEIISETIKKGNPVERLAVIQNGKAAPNLKDVDFYKKQKREVLENCGRIDPRRIEDANERGTYITAGMVIARNPATGGNR